MILGMSAANSTNNLKNRVLIIDEPENHMHPSGIKYMRDEKTFNSLEELKEQLLIDKKQAQKELK